MAGLGKLSLTANTTGWYYLQNDWVMTVVRRTTGDAMLTTATVTTPAGTTATTYDVFVREINATHAFVYYSSLKTAVIAKKVQVGNTGWIVYHPVPTAYDAATLNTITSFMKEYVLSHVYVFQPKADYVQFDETTKSFTVYFDQVNEDGTVAPKYYTISNTTSFTPVPQTAYDVVANIVRVDVNNYLLGSVWALYYDKPSASIKTAFTISPVQ